MSEPVLSIETTRIRLDPYNRASIGKPVRPTSKMSGEAPKIRQRFVDEVNEFEILMKAVVPLIKEYQLQNGRVDDIKVVDH